MSVQVYVSGKGNHADGHGQYRPHYAGGKNCMDRADELVPKPAVFNENRHHQANCGNNDCYAGRFAVTNFNDYSNGNGADKQRLETQPKERTALKDDPIGGVTQNCADHIVHIDYAIRTCQQ